VRLCYGKLFTKIGLVEWLKVKAMISSKKTEKNGRDPSNDAHAHTWKTK
jgi:hypothetical protein